MSDGKKSGRGSGHGDGGGGVGGGGGGGKACAASLGVARPMRRSRRMGTDIGA